MVLISPEYRAQQAQMHDEKKYGKSGGKWWGDVRDLIDSHRCVSWLDYGCGTCKLGKFVRNYMKRIEPEKFEKLQIVEYDPGVRGKETPPEGQFDLVTCIDVLEHIEPDHLNAVMAHLREKTKRILFAVISTRLAGKKLPDGRNAHLIVQDENWWRSVIALRFEIVREWSIRPDEMCILAGPK